ncbi:Uncharacterised protein [Vibrio cholerae]|nr:Uncharacterised protein [Vibrio cholerae]
MTRRTVHRTEIRRIINGDVVIDFRQQHTAERIRQTFQTRIVRATRRR